MNINCKVLILIQFCLFNQIIFIECYGDKAICQNSTKCTQFNKQYILIFCDQIKEPLNMDFDCLKNRIDLFIIRIKYPIIIDGYFIPFLAEKLSILYLEINNVKGFEFKKNDTIMGRHFIVLSLAKTQFDIYYENNLITDCNSSNFQLYKNEFISPLSGEFEQIILINNKYSKICSSLFNNVDTELLQIMDLKISFIKKNVIKFENWFRIILNWQNGSELY